MPAINPERLKQETAELAADFLDPARFVRRLEALLDQYADRIRRPGHTGAPAPLLPAYKVAPPVMRQILLTLTPLVEANPQVALTLADALWEKPFLETRQIAIRLLSLYPVEDSIPILKRLHRWAKPGEEEHILEALFEKGLEPLQSQHPALYLETIREWLNDSQVQFQILGARALLPLAKNPAFENLPLIFRILVSRILDAQPPLRPHLAAVIYVLAERSPQETAHFLRQVLVLTDNPGAAWIARQTFELFSEEIQEKLKETIRNR